MTAGTDAFASGLFTRFDITFLVVEPTVKSVGVYNQYQKYAKEHDVKIQVLANKCENSQDVDFIRDRVGNSLEAAFYRSDYVRAIDKGKSKPLDELEDKNKQALERMVAACDKTERDWATFYQQAKEFHRKNAKSWANDAVGADVTTQIDPDFSLTESVQERG
jgi:CO dehydrogenase maturation factor